jgi:glycosyltransferase involved in cell wall biosynthesis
MQPCTLILFTARYPYSLSGEHTFIEPELSQLSEQFDRIVIVPSMLTAEKLPLRTDAQVETGLAAQLAGSSLQAIARAALTPDGLQTTLLEMGANLPVALHPKSPFRIARWRHLSQIVADWADGYFKQYSSGEKILLYTYWFDHITLGLGKLKPGYPNQVLVSRGHSFDIYAERHRPAYIPFRSETFAGVARLMLASENARSYLLNRYPENQAKLEVFPLGTPDPPGENQPSEDGTVRIVSCSRLVPVKRVDLIIRSLISLATDHPDRPFEWYHFGDGPLMSSLARMLDGLPGNIHMEMCGHLPNEAVMDFYQTHPVDLFINLSRSEAIPVSIMEAQSYAIPVVATAVGGTPEIVSDENGHLLSADPAPDEVATAIWGLAQSPQIFQKRRASRENWEANYRAEVNYRLFATRLRSLVE